MMRLNSSKQGWASCEGCDYSGNVFLNNSKRFGLSTRFQNGSTIQLYDDEAIHPPADGALTIPSSWTDVPARAFMTCTARAEPYHPTPGIAGLVSVTIPNSVTVIGEYGFADVAGLASVVIGSSVHTIEQWAFRGACMLTSLVIPASVHTNVSWLL